MKIEIGDLLQNPVGTSKIVKINFNLDLSDKDVKVEKPILGEAKLIKIENGVLARFDIKTSLQLECVRCLEIYKYPVNLKFDQEYVFWNLKTEDKLAKEEQQEGFIIDYKNSVDIRDAIRQEIVVELPMQTICKENCQGLCIECGQNLNIKKCKHFKDKD